MCGEWHDPAVVVAESFAGVAVAGPIPGVRDWVVAAALAEGSHRV